MSYVNKPTLKSLLNASSGEIFDKKTIDFVFRSILEALVEENTQSVVFLRILNSKGLEGIMKRLNFCQNSSVYNLDYIKTAEFGQTEFIMVSSSRFSAALVWDYSEDKRYSNIFVSMNSDTVNEAFRLLKDKIPNEQYDKFVEYKPERRTNRILNSTLFKIIKHLNENVLESDFNLQERKNSDKKLETLSLKEKDDKKIREFCHEIKNQLSVIDIYTKILSKKGTDSKAIDAIRKSAELIGEHLKQLREIEEYSLKKTSLEQVIKIAIDMTKEVLKQNKNEIIFQNNAKKDIVFIDENKFLGVLINIIKNANESTKGDKVEVLINQKANIGEIAIKNHGEKIPEEIKEEIFKEGFSTKQQGWGIGLFVCRKYLENQACTIELVKSDENSTDFLIKAPFV